MRPMNEIPNYPPTQPLKRIPVDPVARSLAKPDACSKPATMGKVRVRVTQGDKSLRRKRKHGHPDKRDVHFY